MKIPKDELIVKLAEVTAKLIKDNQRLSFQVIQLNAAIATIVKQMTMEDRARFLETSKSAEQIALEQIEDIDPAYAAWVDLREEDLE